MNNKMYIYLLIDPMTNMVRYVGQTYNVERRIKEHINECNSLSKNKSKSHKSNWIKKLKKMDKLPIMEIIETCYANDVDFWERHYISLYKSWGYNLVNKTDGGYGIRGYKYSNEFKLERSCKYKGKGNPFYKKNHTRKTIKAMKKRAKIRFSDPTKNVMYGKKHKESTIELIRQSKIGLHTGDKNPRARKLYEYDINNQLVKIWSTAKECADFYNISRGNISTFAKHNTEVDNGSVNKQYKISKKKIIFKFR